MWQLFDNQGNWMGSCNIEPDSNDLAGRGQTAVAHTPTGAGRLQLQRGKVVELPAAPDAYHTWDGKKWTLTPDAAARQLADARAAKYAQINAAAQAFISAAAELDKVPDFEVKTWERQAAEAEAWAADPAAPTPTLAAIAAARGIDLDDLRGKAIKKARAYSALTAAVAGQRQAYVDQLHAAQTPADIDDINPVYKP